MSPKKEIKIHTEYQENVWTVDVDRGQMEQVLLNLYVNAWQAMPSGGDLFLKTKNVFLDEKAVRPYMVKAGPYVEISVSDTGMGMDLKTTERIFDPFFSTKGVGRGTGLGLASAYGIIKNHEGIIRVESALGEGATFFIYLPVSMNPAEEDRDLTDEIVRGSGTILLVEDEDMILDTVRNMLQELGYTVLAAKSGAKALEIFKEQKNGIDMVILDVIMPGMGGGETYDGLRAIDPGVKVLLSSGYAVGGDAKDILARGCDGFIQKPFSLGALSQKLRSLLSENS